MTWSSKSSNEHSHEQLGTTDGTMHENMGFRGKKGQKIHPNFDTNIAMEFHCHTFCAPDFKQVVSEDSFQKGVW